MASERQRNLRVSVSVHTIKMILFFSDSSGLTAAFAPVTLLADMAQAAR
jgi:hypothetical protein